jgi:hypothetical protein
MQKVWRDPEFRKRQSKTMASPEVRERISAAMTMVTKKRWRDPEYRERMTAARRKRAQDPEYRERMSKSLRKTWRDPEYRKRLSAARRKAWRDPEYRARMNSAEVRARSGLALRERWLSDEKHRKHVVKVVRRNGRRVALGAAVLKRNGVKYDHSLAYAIGKRIDEGAIQEIMTKMFCPAEDRSSQSKQKA